MSKKRRSVFIMLLVVLTMVMAVPVSATTTKHRKKASLKLFNKVYSVKNGKLKLVKNKKYSTVTYVGYFKNGKKCSYDTYYNVVGKLTRYTLKSSSYWSKLFNATRNFG